MRRFQLLYIQCHSRLLVILEGSLEPIRSKQSAVVNWRLFLRHRVWASFLPVPSQQPSAIIRLPAALPHHSSCLLRHSSRTCRNRGNSCSLITSPPLRLLIRYCEPLPSSLSAEKAATPIIVGLFAPSLPFWLCPKNPQFTDPANVSGRNSSPVPPLVTMS